MIVAVTGGKGGVGKSTTSLNLGYELDAVVVDGDLATADLPPGTGPDLHDVLAGRADPVAAVERFGPVRYLSCGRTLAGARAADLSALDRVVERLEREYGRVVIDCPAGLARDVGTQLETAHLAVLVTTPDEAALVDAVRTRRVAADLETPIASVVLNRADRDEHGDLASRVEERFGATTTIVEDRATVDEAQSRWLPVDDVDPDCPAVGAFDEIARTIERSEQRISSRIGVH
ncbi:Cobyrinic acid ac-diamide synthase [Haloterrigena turkmenica DSM 5511]|uniref:Cobyrinic acid ac-diamide synthase n=1 Tax=Haloterrigena turkmenica (strain ATCC 51198 / DSM 5511 / JCM 9101 / NCIMB 13204 / VKM B-1734 / 4k) TaxID=543526 RepID=D2RUB4_HALTV|nr:chromosome partitioning protein ParA [Haloterrigena turkmenica]ADB59183.1 Cobyrinic acid ac-diamide synthase [Haloterrigena turkmenica DSM 5511]